jgi:predicted TIM-barrel fold metal-dependent hydrolase
MSTPIVDVAGVLLDAECWERYLYGFVHRAPNYLRIFGRRFAELAEVESDAYRAAAKRGPTAVVELLLSTGALDADPDALAASLREQGVRRQVLLGNGPGLVNDRTADFVDRHPDLWEGWAGLELGDPDGAIAELHRCVEGRGMRGAACVHFLDGSDPLAASSHRVYAEIARLGLPLWIHVGHNLSGVKAVDFCSWRHLDAIAIAHPQLKLVAGHGGWPWMLEMVAVCQRHPNVYLEFSTHRAPHMAVPGSGWEPIIAHGQATIRHKVLFGSVEWAHGMTPRQLADEVEELPLAPGVAQAWVHDNAARLLGLGPAPTVDSASKANYGGGQGL